MATIARQTITFHQTRASAEAIANANQEIEEDGWTYRVIENGAGKFVVQIFDEADKFISTF